MLWFNPSQLSLLEASDHISFVFQVPGRLSPLLSGVTQKEEYT